MSHDVPARKQRGRTQVLVVSDDFPIARLLTQGLTEAGFAATHVGYPALELAGAHDCAALVLVGPPALAACRRARQQCTGARIVVVASGSRFAAGAATDAGADGVMFEPILIANLVAELRRLLAGGWTQMPT